MFLSKIIPAQYLKYWAGSQGVTVMLQLGKALAILLLNRNKPNKRAMFKSLLSALTVIIVSGFGIAIFSTVLVLGILTCAYDALSQTELSTQESAAIIGLVIITIISGLVCMLKKKISAIQVSFSHLFEDEEPIGSQVTTQATGIAKAFADGLLNRPNKDK